MFSEETNLPTLAVLGLITHIGAGGFALFTLAIPLSSKKGGKLHRTAGKLYVWSMVVICFSAIGICLWRLFLDIKATDASKATAVFLFFIAIFGFSCLAYGISPLNAKSRSTVSFQPRHIAPPILTIIAAVWSMWIGRHLQSTLLAWFPLVGIVASVDQLRYWMRRPKGKMHWWSAHMSGMIAACITTLTAFLVTALPRIFPFGFSKSLLLWLAPTLALTPLSLYWSAKYQRKFQSR